MIRIFVHLIGPDNRTDHFMSFDGTERESRAKTHVASKVPVKQLRREAAR